MNFNNTDGKTICLVLGGRGFLGSHLIPALVRSGYKVRCFDRFKSIGVEEGFHPISDIEYISGDIANEVELTTAITGCDICFHLISTTLPKSSNDDPIFDIESNLISSVKLMSICVKAGVKKVIFTSSGGTVYGNSEKSFIDENQPTNPRSSYGITKLAIEKYLELYRIIYALDYIVLRIANPYGERQKINSGQGAVTVFLNKVLNDEKVEIWGDGSVVRDYIYISDVVNAMVASCNYQGEERVFNIGSGKGKSINQILNSIEIVTGLTVKRVYLPGRYFDSRSNVLSINLADRHLHWKPKVDFNDGLRRCVDWLNAFKKK